WSGRGWVWRCWAHEDAGACKGKTPAERPTDRLSRFPDEAGPPRKQSSSAVLLLVRRCEPARPWRSAAYLGGEQPLRTQHQDDHHRHQGEHLGVRAAHEELADRLRLGD